MQCVWVSITTNSTFSSKCDKTNLVRYTSLYTALTQFCFQLQITLWLIGRSDAYPNGCAGWSILTEIRNQISTRDARCQSKMRKDLSRLASSCRKSTSRPKWSIPQNPSFSSWAFTQSNQGKPKAPEVKTCCVFPSKMDFASAPLNCRARLERKKHVA